MKSLKSTKGFTLVELIVVIAILGILAAVAVPAYSGYIKKASEAGDTQLVASINTAIQSAAAGQGLTAKDVTAAASISSGTATVTLTYSDSTKQTAMQNDLAIFLNATKYDSGVTVSGFKYYTTLTRNSTTGLLSGS